VIIITKIIDFDEPSQCDDFIVDKCDEDMRIDVFLTDELESFSRSCVQKIIKNCCVTLNGKPAKASYKLKAGDVISVSLPELKELEVLPEKMELDILYEDRELIVLNKQQGIVVHPAAGHYTGTLVNGLMHHCKGQLSGINGVTRPGIVHRIDKDTSGVLVIAKSDFAHKCLSAQLAEHSMTRKYEAIVLNKLTQDTGTIDKPIGRHQYDRKKMCITGKNSKRAITHFEVKERFSGCAYIHVSLETGRTHQIRVHMSSIGNPILGDKVYGNADSKLNSRFKLKGQALNAKVLGFIHPVKNEYMEFESQTPDHIKAVLQKVITI